MDPAANNATIVWFTNEATDSQVDYGLTTAYENSTPVNTTLKTEHSMSLTGLTSATTYSYRVKSKDAAGNLAISNHYVFITLGSAGNLPDLEFSIPPEANDLNPAFVNQQFSVWVKMANDSAVAINNFAPEYTVGSSAGASDISSGSFSDTIFQADPNTCSTTLSPYTSCSTYFKLTYKSAGTKKFYVNLDPQNKIAETDENNNTHPASVNVVSNTATTTAAVLDSLNVILEKILEILRQR
jgi:hypothetical protein